MIIFFENGMDARAHNVDKPTVAQMRNGFGELRYCVIGTMYGYARKGTGNIRTWESYSGARRFAREYEPL